jgi:hypothetical protein
MKRRTILRNALGGAAALPALDALRAQQPLVPPQPTPAAVDQIPLIESTIPDLAAVTTPTYFQPGQLEALRRLSDIIMPSIDGVPGAAEAGVPEFLDFLIGQSPESRKKLYAAGLEELNNRSNKRWGKPFPALSPNEADEILAPLRTEWTFEDPDPFTAFLRNAKDDILLATRNSREWIRVMSKRVRSAGGLGMYWYPID